MAGSGRMVMCAKFKRQLPGLLKQPIPGPVGEKVYQHVSEQAWSLWKESAESRVITEFNLKLDDPKDVDIFLDQMQIFLGLKEGEPLYIVK